MKKRAQWPDGYTYSHLLWGLSKLSHFPSALPKALSIYHSMFAENARTKPNTRHLNMVLKCCARTGDMDALWGVVSKIGNDKSGPRPDAITYVIILNAIQRGAIENVPSGATDEELAWHFDRAVLEGRRIWVEVIEKWRQLDLAMDDSLVCAIGRLMLLSWRPRDWDDILSLVQQTQNVSRQTPHWGSAVRKTLDVEMIKGRTEIYRGTPAEMKSDIDDRTRSNRGEEFDSLDGGANLIFAQPTNNTLSLILEACLKLVAKKAADKYWQLLTDAGKFALKPDNDNFNHYLRIMRMAKSSVQATLLVQDDMKNAIPETKTFRIAMSACTRNAGSQQAAAPKAVEHAAILVQIMAKRMKDPDFHTLNAYINLAADRKDPTAMIKAIHDVDGILAKRFKWNDPDAIRDMKEDVQRYFPELCSNMLDSVNWLLSSGHFSRGSKEAKAWIFTREKYSKFVRRPNKKELNSRDAEEGKAVPEKGSHRSVQSINARNIKRMLKQPSQSNDVVVRKAKIYAPPRVRKMA